MFGISSLAELALGELPAAYDNSVADPFAALLTDPDAKFIFLVEANPFNPDLEGTLHGEPPLGTAALGEYDVIYSGNSTMLYLSDYGFTTEPTDSPANQYFTAQVENPFQLEVSIMDGDQFGSSVPSFGAITIINGDGELDGLLDYYWAGRQISVKAGGFDFPYSSFTTIFSGIVSGIEADEDTITIAIGDGRVRVDQQIQQVSYAGTGGLEGGADLANQMKPLCYGEVYNVEPVLVDAANLVYQVHTQSIQAITNVYDAGVALTAGGDVADITAVTPAAGTFRTQLSGGYIKLGSTPSGRITADAQGDTTGTYVNTVSDIVQRIAMTKLGGYSFASSEIDTASFNRLKTAVSGTSGIYITDRIQASEILDQLINPLGAWWTFTRQGLLTCGYANSPGNGILELDEDNIDDEGVKLLGRIPAAWRISVGYKPVGVVQPESELAGAATAAQRALVGEQFRYVTHEDSSILAANQVANEKVFTTQLTSSTDASTLLTRLTTVYGQPRKLYEVPIHRALFRVYVGDPVHITFPRYGLDDGADLIVVGVSEDAETDTTILTLWG